MEDNKKNELDTDIESSENDQLDTVSESENSTDDNGPEGQSEDPGVKQQKELAEQKDKYLRLVAEFENYKRRTAKERIELMQTAGKEVITSLLDVLDDSERAEKQLQTAENAEQIKEGVQLVFNKLRSTLQAKGLKPMESTGSEFDVENHEAIGEVPVEDKSLKGKVVDEVIKGYYLNGKLIRFAKVVVGK